MVKVIPPVGGGIGAGVADPIDQALVLASPEEWVETWKWLECGEAPE
jgi:hypothetical protein